MNRPTARIAVAAATVAVFAAAVVLHASYSFHGIALFDEGLLADGAWRVRDGAVVGRDAYLPYGPGSYWILAPCFALFGQSLHVMRWVLVVVQALADAALFRVARSAGATTPGALLGTVLLAIAHGSMHKSFVQLAALLALLGVQALARRPDAGGALRAGALAGLAFLFRHDLGVFAGLALISCALVEGAKTRAPRTQLMRRLIALAGGFALVIGPAFLALLVTGMDVRSWWDHEWQRISVQERIELSLVSPFVEGELRWGRLALLVALFGAPLVHALWGGAALLRGLRGRPLERDAARVGGALFGLLLLNQARLVPSANHLFQAFAPVALALADLLARRGRARVPSLVGHLGLAAIVGGVATWAALGLAGPYSGTFKQRIAGAVELDLPTAGVFVEPEQAQWLRAVVASIQERVPESSTIFTSPGCPLFGFLANRRLALPYAEPSYYYFDPRFQQEAIAALERSQPPLFVMDSSRPAGYRFEEAAPLVAQYVATHYQPVESIGPYTIAQRVR